MSKKQKYYPEVVIDSRTAAYFFTSDHDGLDEIMGKHNMFLEQESSHSDMETYSDDLCFDEDKPVYCVEAYIMRDTPEVAFRTFVHSLQHQFLVEIVMLEYLLLYAKGNNEFVNYKITRDKFARKHEYCLPFNQDDIEYKYNVNKLKNIYKSITYIETRNE